eukprot:6490499-Amphidinium_carterae.1
MCVCLEDGLSTKGTKYYDLVAGIAKARRLAGKAITDLKQKLETCHKSCMQVLDEVRAHPDGVRTSLHQESRIAEARALAVHNLLKQSEP